MSFKRNPQAYRKGSGRIKYGNNDLSKLNFEKATDSINMRSEIIFQQDKQNVVESSCNGESMSELEISTSNLSIPSQTDITHDISSVNVDEWFKQRTESVSSIDLDTVMKNDGIDATYLSENMGHTFLSNKDVDMTCIVTNICDIGLGLDMPSSSQCRSKKQIVGADCENTILNHYKVEQDTLLNDLDRTDLLDKDMLVENTVINSSPKGDLGGDRSENQSLSENYAIGHNQDSTSLSEGNQTSLLKPHKTYKENLWNGSEISDVQPSVECGKEKSAWESLSTTSKRSVDADSEKEMDFPEFNLITFHIDTNDAMCSINQIEMSDKETTSLSSDDNMQTILSSKMSVFTVPVDVARKEDSAILAENDNVKSSPKTSTLTNIPAPTAKSTLIPSSNPRSLLKSPLKRTNVSKSLGSVKTTNSVSQTKALDSWGQTVDASQDSPTSPKKTPSMAIIAISTDKSKNTTEIVINTPYGEQVFKGKTSDLMKATSGLWQKLDTNRIQKADQPLTISMMNEAMDQCSTLDDSSSHTLPLAADVTEEGEEFGDPATEEDQTVVEALAELGITVDKDNIFCVTTGPGQKLWVCPMKDCGKMFPRQSMLKVHILSHFNVRPFKCNFTGCHWSFYTYFKLKRHKETHLKRKDFVCPIKNCERRFTTIYNLNTHQKLHSRPLEMVCPVETCAARFQTKRSLELHLKSHDRHHAPYKCSFEGCEKHYYSLNSLNSHLRSHQHKEEEVRCQWEGCGKLFDKPCRLKAHMRSHTGDKPYPCMYQDCGWAFPSASKLKRHQQKHTNERKFQCNVDGCGKSFMRSEHLKEHTLTHEGQRNFHCPFENCGVKFSAKSSLYVHLKKHNKTESEAADKVFYHCPIEKCTRTYTCKSSLRQHMLKFHTPVLANDPSQLDYIALLTGDDDLATLEGLQFSGDITPAVNGAISSLSTVSLITPPSLMTNTPEGIVSVPSDYINTDFQLPAMLQCAGESGTSPAATGNNVVTHVVLAQPEVQNATFSISTQA